ncbi:MAG TPA: hypothetical protein VFO83_02430 [Aggregicoccus sp.]|nr:hypothetical protein [Aggregicoccus sp.]
MSPTRSTLFACALLALLVPTAAQPQSTTPVNNAPYLFETVDSYDVRGGPSQVVVTGVLQGEAAPTTLVFRYSAASGSSYESPRTFERCERMALLAMSKPGQYLLELRQDSVSGYTLQVGCKLTRR